MKDNVKAGILTGILIGLVWYGYRMMKANSDQKKVKALKDQELAAATLQK